MNKIYHKNRKWRLNRWKVVFRAVKILENNQILNNRYKIPYRAMTKN